MSELEFKATLTIVAESAIKTFAELSAALLRDLLGEEQNWIGIVIAIHLAEQCVASLLIEAQDLLKYGSENKPAREDKSRYESVADRQEKFRWLLREIYARAAAAGTPVGEETKDAQRDLVEIRNNYAHMSPDEPESNSITHLADICMRNLEMLKSMAFTRGEGIAEIDWGPEERRNQLEGLVEETYNNLFAVREWAEKHGQQLSLSAD